MSQSISRRDFVRTGATAGAGFLISPAVLAVENTAKPKAKDAIHLGLIGAGAQGQVLMDAVIKISKDTPVCFRAVCDIWEPNRTRVARTLNAYRAYGHAGKAYVDYREMLDKEKDLDAVIGGHARLLARRPRHRLPQGGPARLLREGDVQHPGGGTAMVEAAKATGKLLQIGHQRRSNPRYRFCYDQIIQQARMLGRITTINGQWNRGRAPARTSDGPKGAEIARGHAQPVRLCLHAAVPQLAVVQGAGRRSHRGPRLASDRHLQLVPRDPPRSRRGQRRHRLLGQEDPPVV